ncbi:MAG: RNA pseudouridine synthase [Planctomycetaceae bacterium]|nr:RNA pseudouridine synthase [Planctomycetaceae bacterium]
MEPNDFDLLYEEGPCLVVSKPAGILTQAPPGIDSLEVRIKQFLKVRDDKPGKVYLGVPHRLDRPVSGAMVFAKHVRAARRLCDQFQGRTIEKTYWALVEGCVEQDDGTWEDEIRKVPNEARAELVDGSQPDRRTAVMHFQVMERLPTATFLTMRLETGRYHQIRVQSAARGYPIVGDDLYGSQAAFGPQTDDRRTRWIALHAYSLSFRHPMSGERHLISSPLPDLWREYLPPKS